MLGVCRESNDHVMNHGSTFRTFGNGALAARPALLSRQISTDSSSDASTPELAPQKSFASLQFGFPNPLSIVQENYYALRTTPPYQEPDTQTTPQASHKNVVVEEQKPEPTNSERLENLPVVQACTVTSKKSASKSTKNVAVAIAVNDLELGAKMLLELGAHHIGGRERKRSDDAVTQESLAAAVAAATTAVVDVDDSDSDESRLFPCGACDKFFHKRSDLQRHARVHSGERPFTCPKCHKSFKERFVAKARSVALLRLTL